MLDIIIMQLNYMSNLRQECSTTIKSNNSHLSLLSHVPCDNEHVINIICWCTCISILKSVCMPQSSIQYTGTATPQALAKHCPESVPHCALMHL